MGIDPGPCGPAPGQGGEKKWFLHVGHFVVGTRRRLRAQRATRPADLEAAKKMGDWLDLVLRQGDEFVPIAVGGYRHEDALDLLSDACAAIMIDMYVVVFRGGSEGRWECTGVNAFRWCSNARGVAKVIKARTPVCAGDHHPVQPHHFSHQPAVRGARLQPRSSVRRLTPHQSALPALATPPPPRFSTTLPELCLPCTPTLHALCACDGAAPSPLLLGDADDGRGSGGWSRE